MSKWRQSLVARYAAVMTDALDAAHARRRLRALATGASTVDPRVRLAAIEARLPVTQWPARNMLLPAVDAATGDFRVFTREFGVTLLDAVAASCAVLVSGRR